MNYKLIVPAVIIMGVAATLGATTTFAQTTTSEGTTHPLVQKLATRFGLKESDVKAVFDEVHQERHAEMLAKFTAELDAAIQAGKLTVEQKNLIVAKHEELQSQRETERTQMANITEEQRKAAREALRAELKKWASDNGIDEQYLMPKLGKGRGNHEGFGPRQ